MSITLTQYKTALKENIRKPIYKIEWMDSDENVTDEITNYFLDGTVNMEYINGMRRDCNISLINKDGVFIPDTDGYIYLNKKFKLYTGLNINGEEYYNAQGVFNLGNPKIKKGEISNIIQIEGYDNFALLNGSIEGELEDDYIIPIGTQITTAVKAILALSSIPKTPIVSVSTETIPYSLVKEVGSNYGELLTELADILSWVFYIDVNGHPRFEPPVDELNTAPIDLLSNNEVALLGYTHEYQYDEVKNYIKVYGDNINGDLATGIAQNDGLFSETAVARIGKRTKTIHDSNIYSDSLAQDRADWELKKLVQLYESVDATSIPLDYIKEGDLISVEDINTGLNRDKYLIKKISTPLNFNKQQSFNLWKVRELE